MDYRSKNHSKYLIMYHIIFVCKYRKKYWEIYTKSRLNNFAMENIDKYEKIMGIILNEIDTRNIENRFNVSI